ncbi:pilus assembly protein TadG-related protein [Bradyrhizobium septentrionale]|uniref:Pilus assembly protein TadG-related protein n=1 Tax=Bradyrhizobium septentrionale TaxID=1404411 RepID=A0ABZ2NR65_9BRAD
MRKLRRCRRGSVAFATVIAMVPLVGVMALGGEAASWYVTKQRAQSAADTAAISGALRVQCTDVQSSGGQACTDTQDATWRARQFAAQNAFCDGSDTNASSYPGAKCPTGLPSGTSQQVTIAVGASQVQATVSQTQTTHMARLLGLSTVTIAATAIARVITLSAPCVLSLKDPLIFQGSTAVSSPNCGLATNNTTSSAIQFTGSSANAANAKSLSAPGGCSNNGSANQCSKAITYAAATPNPLSPLDSPMSNLSTATTSFSSGACGTTAQPTAYDASHHCYNLAGNGSGKFNFGSATYNLNGVYFFSGDVTVNGSAILQLACAAPACGVTFVLLPGSTLNINGGAKVQLTASDSVTTAQVPPALASVVNLMAKLLIYDPESTGKNQTVGISGNSSSYFNGIVYAPKADITYQGSSQNYGCNMVIAMGVAFSGSSNFDNSTCPATSAGAVTRYVRLVTQ